MTRKQRRLTLIGLAGLVLATATALVLYALNEEITFFMSPTDIVEQKVDKGQRIRLGGLVEDGSVESIGDATTVFTVTDNVEVVKVSYTGILPDLFREGQGVVAEGYVDSNGVFLADQVLAKHDENYIPKEVYESLKEDGLWEGDKKDGE